MAARMHGSRMAKGFSKVYYGVSKLYCQHIFQNILTWDEVIDKMNQTLML